MRPASLTRLRLRDAGKRVDEEARPSTDDAEGRLRWRPSANRSTRVELMPILLDGGQTTSPGFTGARFIRHVLSFPSFDVLPLAVAMILATLRAALMLAVRFAVALGLGFLAAAIAAVPLSSEVRTTDAEHCSAPAALSSKKGDTTLLHDRPLGEASARQRPRAMGRSGRSRCRASRLPALGPGRCPTSDRGLLFATRGYPSPAPPPPRLRRG